MICTRKTNKHFDKTERETFNSIKINIHLKCKREPIHSSTANASSNICNGTHIYNHEIKFQITVINETWRTHWPPSTMRTLYGRKNFDTTPQIDKPHKLLFQNGFRTSFSRLREYQSTQKIQSIKVSSEPAAHTPHREIIRPESTTPKLCDDRSSRENTGACK